MDVPQLEKEVDRIQKTAEKQLASVHGLNVSLVKKIRKAEAQVAGLLDSHKDLEHKNATLVAQLSRAQENVRALSLKEKRLAEVEQQLSQANSAIVAAELAVKKSEARYDGAVSEKDALQETVRSVELKLEEGERQIAEVKDAAKKEKDSLDRVVKERGLEVEALKEERDQVSKARDDADQTVKARDADLEKVNATVVALTKEKDHAIADGETKVKEVEDRLVATVAESDTIAKQLEELKNQHEATLADKATLEKDLDELRSAKEQVEEKLSASEKDLAEAKDSIDQISKEKDDVKADLDAKTNEAEDLNTRFIALGTERDELTKRKDDLETTVEQSQREVDDTKAALEEKNLAFSNLEQDRNLLQSEKSNLEKDFSEARDRSKSLDDEKRALEMRVMQLEEVEKKLVGNVDSLEKEKLTLIAAHQKELHDQIIKKDEEIARQHAELRTEIDDVLERNAALRRAEMERDEKDFPETIEMPPPASGAPVVAEDVTMDRVMALDTPKDIPEEGAPTVEEPTAKVTPSGEMVMVREKVEDTDVPEAPEAPMAGDTTGIVSEEVMEEMVVDERETGDDVLEEIDEEEPVDKATADKTRKLAMDVKSGETAGETGDKVTKAGEKAGKAATDTAKAGVTFAADAGKAATEAAKKTVEKTADAAAKGAEATRDAGTKTKKGAGAIWSKVTACCVAPSKTVGDEPGEDAAKTDAKTGTSEKKTEGAKATATTSATEGAK